MNTPTIDHTANSVSAVYCATGDYQHLRAAIVSATALIRLNPGMSATIFTDLDMVASDFFKRFLGDRGIDLILIPRIREKFASRIAKIQAGMSSPYETTLYLDSDILPLRPIENIAGFLEGGDLGMVRDRIPCLGFTDHIDRAQVDRAMGEGVPLSAPQYNGGLFLWKRSERTSVFFRSWMTEWEKFRQQDQVALTTAIWKTGIQVYEMPAIYNYPPLDYDLRPMPENPDVKLLHCWGGQVMSGEFFRKAEEADPENLKPILELERSF